METLHASEQLRWHIWPTFPLNFFMKFSQKMPHNFFYTMGQKSQKWPKTQIKRGGGGPALSQRKRCLLRSADRGRKEKKTEKNRMDKEVDWKSDAQKQDRGVQYWHCEPAFTCCSWIDIMAQEKLHIRMIIKEKPGIALLSFGETYVGVTDCSAW